jgi:hypothetical protein
VKVRGEEATEIWLDDDAGDLVQKGVGTLRTSLVPGASVVGCALETSPEAIPLAQASRDTPPELDAWRTCVRPIPPFPPEEGRTKGGGHAAGVMGTSAPSRPTSGWSGRGDPRRSPCALDASRIKPEEQGSVLNGRETLAGRHVARS